MILPVLFAGLVEFTEVVSSVNSGPNSEDRISTSGFGLKMGSEYDFAVFRDLLETFLSLPLSGNLIVIFILYVFDKLAAPRRARWFALHGFANMLVVVTAFNGTITSLRDPLYSLDSRIYRDKSLLGCASPWPVYIINALHVYHLLFFDVKGQELFHHLVFVPVIGFMGQYFDWGAAQGFMAFFISGLPGAIDYLLLVLVKYNKIDTITQKRVCAALNVYVRGPFIIISAHTIYLAMLYGNLTVPKWACTSILIIALFNSLYYTKQSVANWAVSSVVASFVEMTGMELPNLKEIGAKISAKTQTTVS